MQLDLIVENANILTQNPDRPRASAMGVWNGLIVGLDGDISGLEARERVNAGGRTVVPGFNDVHCHMSAFGQQLREIDAGPMRSLDELYDAVARFAAEHPDEEWITGASYDQTSLGDHPDREALDRASGGKKVMIIHRTRHMLTASSAVFAELGAMDASYPVPDGGEIRRHPDGSPTGLVAEQAMTAFRALRQPVAEDELVECLELATQQFLREGITSASEAGIGRSPIVGSTAGELSAYMRGHAEGRIRVRTEVMPTMENFHDLPVADADGYGSGLDLGLRTGFGSGMLTLGPLKVFTDGALTSRTAAMSENFCGHDHAGMLLFDREQLESITTDAHKAGWQLAVHAIGDVAIDLALDLLDTAQQSMPRTDARHRIEHASVIRDDQLQRFIDLGVIPSIQGRFVNEIGDSVASVMGADRLPWTYRHRSLLDGGLVVPGGSDRPVVNGAPLVAMQAMVERRTASGAEFNLHEAVTAEEALKSYTVDSAYASRAESIKGSLEARKYADFVVLSEDPTAVPASEISQIQVESTWVGGECRYRAG